MRVALDNSELGEARPSGIGRYAQALLPALAATAAPGDRLLMFWRWRQRRACARLALPAGVSWCLRHGDHPLRWPGPQVVHGLHSDVPLVRGAARLATVHDLTPFTNPGGLDDAVLAFGRERLLRAAARSQVLVANSAHTRDEAVRWLGVPAGRIAVTHLGVEQRFRPHAPDELAALRARLDLPAAYLLAVSDLNPRKNLPRLLEALALRPDAPPLLLVGKPAAGEGALAAAVVRHGLERRVRLLGFVADADLPPLYAGAAALCYPSLHEGFGFPILEAMRSGTPVLTATAGACPEVAGGHAALADPLDPAAIAAALDRALASTPGQRQAARLHAEGFTWESCARRTWEAYALALRLAGA